MSTDTQVKVGDRIELVRTDDPYTRLTAGDRGTVTRIAPGWKGQETIDVKWDSGSTLSLIPDSGDRFRVI